MTMTQVFGLSGLIAGAFTTFFMNAPFLPHRLLAGMELVPGALFGLAVALACRLSPFPLELDSGRLFAWLGGSMGAYLVARFSIVPVVMATESFTLGLMSSGAIGAGLTALVFAYVVAPMHASDGLRVALIGAALSLGAALILGRNVAQNHGRFADFVLDKSFSSALYVVWQGGVAAMLAHVAGR